MILRPRSSLFAALLLAVSACGSSGGTYFPRDLGSGSTEDLAAGESNDLANSPLPDFATAPRDLATKSADLAKGSGACNDQADITILQAKQNQMQAILFNCASNNLAQEPATKNCIQQMTGLSNGCTQCFDTGINCVISNCFNQCMADPSAQMCVTCRKTNCDPTFEACAGVPIP